ncbi:MAG TPA: SPFH domain-containing protein [Tenuifilaceae bacterium]|nr:SPFH domain-containing protein [Tenuifilaceae bacterium]HPI43954.1 SPFH domain-containing protein [Tenuifilaceae bacterium]HPN20398.1 SPFH domain-containing protein [Tenuifilaceae bacterium]
MKTTEEKFSGLRLSGIFMLLFNILFLFGIIFFFVRLVSSPYLTDTQGAIYGISLGFSFILNLIFWAGFMQIEPNEARVMVFFGKYEGTIKDNGFFWVNPFYAKKRLTLRARNLDAEPIKVNDKTGNPVMIGVVVVWRLADTYKASFHVDNASMAANVAGATATAKLNEKMMAYQNFVKIQCDAALRYVAGLYSYDHSGTSVDSEMTLRSNGEEINQILEQQMNERLAIAGIEVIEARINYLAYAPEIAAVMLRRQQADAIIAAREKIVDGAVGMVKLALTKLADDKIIEFDEDKKAAMVSNLMVVLCSEDSASPIINAGTLHQ